ncbi:MAG: hypothetical protein RL565_1445 [Pseudomonadota bacterium]|jgi:hypothetical protein
MNNQSSISQQQIDAFEKGFLYLDIATQFLHLVYSDLRRDDSILSDQQRRSELMDCIACLMDDAKELTTNAVRGGDNE